MPEAVSPAPVVGDGFVDVPKGVLTVAELDPTIAHVLDQQFANQAQEFNAQANRARAGDSAVSELVRNVAVQTTQLVGAKAAQNLEVDRTMQQVLLARAVRDQPASTPFAEPAAKTA